MSQLSDAITRYEDARQLLGKENDVYALWKAITAADALHATIVNARKGN